MALVMNARQTQTIVTSCNARSAPMMMVRPGSAAAAASSAKRARSSTTGRAAALQQHHAAPRSSPSSSNRRGAATVVVAAASGGAAASGDSGAAEPAQQQQQGGALATICGVLSAVAAVKAAAGAIAPGALVAMVARGDPSAATDPVLSALVGVAVSAAWLAAAYLQALKDAIIHDRLKSDTYKRLAVALMSTSALAALSAARFHELLGAPLVGAALVGAGLVGALMSRVHAGGAAGGGASPLADLKAVAAGALGGLRACVATRPANLYSAFYALQAVTCAAGVAVLWPTDLTPLFPQGLGLAGRYLTRACAAGLVLVGVTAYTLKDAADRGRLGASTFRLLSLALAATAAQTTWFFYTLGSVPGLALNRQLWAGILAQGVACVAVSDLAFFTAKKKAA